MAASDVVLDASVALAWVLPEVAEAKLYAQTIAQAGREGAVFHAPYVFEAEVAAGLVRAMRARKIDLDTLRAALDEFESVGVVVHHYPYTSRILADIAIRYQVQVSDGLYFHLAKIYELPIATLDGGLRTAAKAHASRSSILSAESAAGAGRVDRRRQATGRRRRAEDLS